MKVINYCNENQELIKNFLNQVPSLTNLDDLILNNILGLVDQDKVVATISFERYQNFGLIRYFVFHTYVSQKDLTLLFNDLLRIAKEKHLEKIFALVENPLLLEIFSIVGMDFFDERLFIINEASARYHQLKVMVRDLES